MGRLCHQTEQLLVLKQLLCVKLLFCNNWNSLKRHSYNGNCPVRNADLKTFPWPLSSWLVLVSF